MSFSPDSLSTFRSAPFDTVIDVRAPSEFVEDHVPGAINLPVLSDAERARIGTIYVQQSAFLARKIGAALVARNAAQHIEGPLAGHDGGWRPLVYCWRGGQRSNSFASILTQIGWRVSVLDGGYRNYRALVRDMLYDRPFPARMVLIDGNTGTAKTELLMRAAERGVQVIDLEGLANHRGSLFGGRGEQPSQKGFESTLAEVVRGLDPDRPVLVEAESSKVGARTVPPTIWSAMRAAPRLVIEAPLRARARYLSKTYADIVADPARLDETLHKLIPLQGRQTVAAWRALAEAGAVEGLATELMRVHYDPRYAKQRGRGGDDRHEMVIETDELGQGDLDRLADRIASEIARL